MDDRVMSLDGVVRRVVAGLIALSACSGHTQGVLADPVPVTVSIEVSATTCTADRSSAPAGPVVFSVSSAGAVAGSEVELLDGHRVLGEEEAVHDGHVGGFALQLPAGHLQLVCLAGGRTISKGFTLTPAKPRHLSAAAAARQGQLRDAATSWRAWVQGQLDQLVTATVAFADAVRAGHLDDARRLYAPARVFYERVEPVAESFGDLDPAIDARIDDVSDPELWTGFHRLEKGLFADGSTAGLAPYATQLEVQVTQLDHLARGITVSPGELASGAQALLEEVARTKITGEEERYSHLDLVDLAANVEGAQRAYGLVRPTLAGARRSLAEQVDQRFATLDAVVQSLRTGPGPTDFPPYTSVTEAQRRTLSDAVDGVAEPYSAVPALLVV